VLGFVALTGALVLASYLTPANTWLLIWISVGLASVVAVVRGVTRYRPRRRSAWWLIMAALLALTLGEVTRIGQVAAFRPDMFPTVADFVYLGLFVPLMIVGMWRLVRSGTPALDRAGLFDALIVTAAVAVVTWSFLIDPLVMSASSTFPEKLVAAGYPISGVLVLATMVRLAVGIRLTPTVGLQVIGVLGMVVGSAVYGVLQLQAEWRVDGPALLGWLVLLAGWGASALDPSMAELTAPRTLRPVVLTRARLVGLAVAALLAPLALVVEAARGLPGDMLIRRVLLLLLFVSVLVRLYTAVDHQLRGSARERGLRCASAALVRATGPEEVAEAVRAAVRHLLPTGTPHEVVVEIAGAGGVPVTVPDARAGAPAAAPDRSIHPLDPAPAHQPEIPDAVLRCPLVTPDGCRSGGQVGALYVAAGAPMLVELETSLDVVASQAAMALERIRLTEEINRHASERYFRTLVHNTADVILIVEEDDTVRYASPSAAIVLEVERPDRLTDLIAPDHWPAVARTLHLARAGPPVPVTADWTMLAAGGSRLQAEAVCQDMRADPTVAGLVITLRDVTEQRRLQRELTHLAYHDPLTGLANRALLRERLERALRERDRDGAVVGVLFLDVDDLKAVNDTLGHPAGDDLLAATGRRLAGALRRQDTAARLGGDEFAALIVGARSAQEVEQVAHRVVTAFAEPFQLAGQLVSRAVSVGVATTADASDGEELLRQADLALYVAKSAGKARWSRYGDSPGQAAPHRIPRPGVHGIPYPQRAQPDGGLLRPSSVLVRGPPGPVPPGMAGPDPTALTTAGLHPTGLMSGRTGLIVPIGAWVLESELAQAAARSFPVTVAGVPRLRVDVSADRGYQMGSLAMVHRAPAPAAQDLVRLSGWKTVRDDEQLWVDAAALWAADPPAHPGMPDQPDPDHR
jgi:diguanylate cyclase (GGDEF)-like protein/PAS domain S-box-containing protein